MSILRMVERRRADWIELERMCTTMSKRRVRLDPVQSIRFSSLYRDACADLALAEAWELPPATVEYLQTLVARAHNRLYRSQSIDLTRWLKAALLETPRQIFSEPAVHVAAAVFWGLSLLSGYLAWNEKIWPDFAEQVLGTEQLENFERMYENFDGGNSGKGNQAGSGGGAGGQQGGVRSPGNNVFMAGYYIWNNAGIGLQCFASMVLILPGFVTLASNAVQIGAVDGYMLRPDIGMAGVHFRNFTTAHGPLELTAIVLSAGAGLKIGLGWFWSRGLRRMDGLLLAGRESLPIAICGVILFVLAAIVEGFISPMPDYILPWWIKGLVALLSSGLMMFYFVVLGFPWQRR